MKTDLTEITDEVAASWYAANHPGQPPYEVLTASHRYALKAALLPIINQVAEAVEEAVRKDAILSLDQLPAGDIGGMMIYRDDAAAAVSR